MSNRLNDKCLCSHIVPPLNCVGCGLCANVCSQNAISMVWSGEGFLMPSVDENRCIECGLCVKRCIALEETPAPTNILHNVESYGAWNRDMRILRASSSGGVFSALASCIFAKGGCVFGVVWQDKETAVFTKAEDMEELSPMRGSKYTPAVPGYVYREVRDELKAGRYVLFSGTPCQVHALKAYLRKGYERLVTLDIACHGVPSRLVLQKYIREREEERGCKLERVTFRDKSMGWAAYGYNLIHHYGDGKMICRRANGDPFMQMFISDGALNHSCYSCPYAHSPRQGDLSVGDYWGVEKYHADWPLSEGVSTLIVNTSRGKELLSELSAVLHLHAEPFERICEQNEHVYAKAAGEVSPHRPYAMAKLQDARASLQEAIDESTTYSVFGGVRFRRNSLFMQMIRLLKRVFRTVLR